MSKRLIIGAVLLVSGAALFGGSIGGLRGMAIGIGLTFIVLAIGMCSAWLEGV